MVRHPLVFRLVVAVKNKKILNHREHGDRRVYLHAYGA